MSSMMCPIISGSRNRISPCDHVFTTGASPMCTCSMNTMPQRETVAGDATARSITSNIMCT